MTRRVWIAMPGNEGMTSSLTAEAARMLAAAGMPKPVCIGIHGLFSGDSFSALSRIAERVVTTNSVVHESNAIDLSAPIASAIAEMPGA